MPLEKSPSKDALKRNVGTLMSEVGKSPHVGSKEQALAIAYSIQRRNKNRAAGGGMGSFDERSAARSLMKGPILSNVPGRTDAHAGKVTPGSYVVPADIVSGRGQGNTLAGANVLQRLFKMGPYGSAPASIKTGSHSFGQGFGVRAPKAVAHADGGATEGADSAEEHVPVNLAGGELIIPPENLTDVVHPNLKHAHAIMDQWVLDERKNLRKTLANLPGPVKE